jgi:radical S-adenosyl methionine domain-containing protein 2
MVAETNADMKGSYVIVQPDGGLIDNSAGRYRVVDNLLHQAVNSRLPADNTFSAAHFQQRGGVYTW